VSEPEITESATSLPSLELIEAPPSLVPIAIELQGRTDVGREREHNEDNFLVADLSRGQRGGPESYGPSVVVGGHGLLLAVCDGMGGAAAGEVASQMAVDVIHQHVVSGLPLEAPLDRDAIARRLVRAVEEAGFRIFEAARADRSRRGMGTTATAAALVDETLFLAQVGDSRAYVLRDEKLVQVTRDQSLVNQLIEAGQLTEEEAETFEHNNIILQALGTSDHVQVDLTYAELRAGDRLLLCSDGLSGMVRNEEIRKILFAAATPAEAAQVLIQREAGGRRSLQPRLEGRRGGREVGAGERGGRGAGRAGGTVGLGWKATQTALCIGRQSALTNAAEPGAGLGQQVFPGANTQEPLVALAGLAATKRRDRPR